MLKRHTLIVAYLFISSLTHGSPPDPNRSFEFYLKNCREYLDNEVQMSAAYLDSAFFVAIKNERKDQLGISMNQRGLIFLRKGDLDSAGHYYSMSLEYLKSYSDSLKVRPLKNLGVLAYFKGDIDGAIEKHVEVLDHYLEVRNPLEIARTYSNLGVFYKNTGKFIMASECYLKGLEYFEIIGDESGLANVNNNIGSIYIELERHEEAFPYFRKAIEKSSYGNTHDRAIWNINMSIVLRELGSLDSAIHYQEIALKYYREVGDSSGIAQAYHEFGLTKMTLQDYHSAREYLQNTLHIAQRIGDKKYQAMATNNLAEIELLTGNAKAALQVLEQHAGNKELQIQSERTRQRKLATAYHLLGHDQQALIHLKKYRTLNDSIKNSTINLQLDELNTLYESKEKEKTISEQQLALEFSKAQHRSDIRLILLVASSILLSIGCILAYLRYQNLRKNKQLLQGKVDIAKTQMSPEFLYDSLGIVSKLLDHSAIESEEAIYKLSRLYQKMVENFDEDLVPLEDELILLKSYIDLISMGDAITFEFQNDILSPEKYAVVPFSLQTLFESAISDTSIKAVQCLRIYENDQSIVVENQSTGGFIKTKSSFPFIDEKYKVVCGRGISVELPEYGTLIKIPKIKWAV